MGLDVALLNLLSIALTIETFKKIEGEKLEERLKNKSNEEIKEILLSKNLPASKEQTILAKESRKSFQNQVTRNLKLYWSKEKKAIGKLLRRGQHRFLRLPHSRKRCPGTSALLHHRSSFVPSYSCLGGRRQWR